MLLPPHQPGASAVFLKDTLKCTENRTFLPESDVSKRKIPLYITLATKESSLSPRGEGIESAGSSHFIPNSLLAGVGE